MMNTMNKCKLWISYIFTVEFVHTRSITVKNITYFSDAHDVTSYGYI